MGEVEGEGGQQIDFTGAEGGHGGDVVGVGVTAMRALGPRMATATARQMSASKAWRGPWSSEVEYSGVSWLMPQRRVLVADVVKNSGCPDWCNKGQKHRQKDYAGAGFDKMGRCGGSTSEPRNPDAILQKSPVFCEFYMSIVIVKFDSMATTGKIAGIRGSRARWTDGAEGNPAKVAKCEGERGAQFSIL